MAVMVSQIVYRNFSGNLILTMELHLSPSVEIRHLEIKMDACKEFEDNFLLWQTLHETVPLVYNRNQEQHYISII